MIDNIVRLLCSSCVDTPEDMTFQVSQNEQGVFYVITPSPEEVGQLIGRNGELINSIRIVVRAIARTHQLDKIFLDISTSNSTKGP